LHNYAQFTIITMVGTYDYGENQRPCEEQIKCDYNCVFIWFHFSFMSLFIVVIRLQLANLTHITLVFCP